MTPIHALLERAATDHGDSCALVVDGDRLTFRDLLAQSNAVAAGLRALGLGTGDVVSYQLPNGLDGCLLFLAIQAIGGIANPIIPIYRQREVGFIVRESGAKALVVPRHYRKFDHYAMACELAAESPGLKVLTASSVPGGQTDIGDMIAQGRSLAEQSASLDDDALLIYTSGTTSNPKGVRHSQRTLLSDASSVVQTTSITEDDVIFLASPITHMTGLLYGNILPLLHANKLVLMDRWDPTQAASVIAHEGCTWTTGATPFLQTLVNAATSSGANLSTLRVFRCGGAEVPPSLIRQAQKLGINAFRTYGSSEHPTVSGVADGDADRGATTDGKIHPGVDVKIVSIDDESIEMPTGETGEIQTKGAEVFLGYKDAALNRAAFTADGWFRTGDLGSVDADGYLTIRGRIKDIIIRKGENISAKEVEDALGGLEGLREVTVVGVPDAERGEMLVAVGIADRDPPPSLGEVSAHLEQTGLARQKFPEQLEWVESYPRTASGKIKKNEVKSMILQRVSEKS